MSRRLEYFFDYVSPFSYLADTQIPALAERAKAEVLYRPMLLGGVFKATGNQAPVNIPAKGKYMSTELGRWTKRYGVRFTFNPTFPINTVGLMRAALVTIQEGSFRAYHDAIFRAMWRDSMNLGDEGVVREVIEKAGLDANRILERTQEPAIKEQLKAATAEAVQRGAFGAPSIFVGDELFWGCDRLDFVEEALNAIPS